PRLLGPGHARARPDPEVRALGAGAARRAQDAHGGAARDRHEDAGEVAERGRGRGREGQLAADAARARRPRRALVAAGAAVLRAALRVHALPGAVGEAGRAGARPGGAGRAPVAGVAAGAAVRVARLR